MTSAAVVTIKEHEKHWPKPKDLSLRLMATV